MQILYSEGNENGIHRDGLDFIKGSVEKLKPNLNGENILDYLILDGQKLI